ncbi:hypothetical protein BvRS1_03490 [Burkholderia vietnamiensis]|nr:hypothetical protein BvRS1_03490 [Burkholderia vietnamiensis]
MKNHSEAASIVAPIAAANMLAHDACPIAAMVPPRMSIGTAGTGTPSCVISTLANTAHGPGDEGIATGKGHTAARLEDMRTVRRGGRRYGRQRSPRHVRGRSCTTEHSKRVCRAPPGTYRAPAGVAALRERRDVFRVLRERGGQRGRVRQLELGELEPRRDRAADQRDGPRRGAPRTEPAPGRHDGLEHGARMRERVAEPVYRQPVVLVEHPHPERVACVEMPDLVRTEPVPR